MKRSLRQVLVFHSKARDLITELRSQLAIERRKVRALERIIECQESLKFHPIQSESRLRDIVKAKRALSRIGRKEAA